MRIEMYRPDSEEETRGLIAETWSKVILDARTTDVTVKREGVAIDPDASPAENVMRIWRDLVPDQGAAWYGFRVQYGWTRDEIREVRLLLGAAYNELVRVSMDVPLDGTRGTLLHDAKRFGDLYNRWVAVVGYTT